MGERVLNQIQFGVGAVNGTAVAADTRLLGEVTMPSDAREWVRPGWGTGTRVPRVADNTFLRKVGPVQIAFNTPAERGGAYYQMLPLLFSACLDGNITPAEDNLGEADWRWTFTDRLTGAEDLDTFTLEYGDDSIFEDLVSSHSAITVSETDGVYTINANMEDLQPDTSKMAIRDKSVELVSMCQTGGLDYAFEYSSVAKQHGLLYLELPSSIDLSDVAYTDEYAMVKVEKTTGTSTGKPIVYGITIPSNAPNPELAAEFIEYVINEFGRGVFTDQGQPPFEPAIASDLDSIPESLLPFVTEQD